MVKLHFIVLFKEDRRGSFEIWGEYLDLEVSRASVHSFLSNRSSSLSSSKKKNPNTHWYGGFCAVCCLLRETQWCNDKVDSFGIQSGVCPVYPNNNKKFQPSLLLHPLTWFKLGSKVDIQLIGFFFSFWDQKKFDSKPSGKNWEFPPPTPKRVVLVALFFFLVPLVVILSDALLSLLVRYQLEWLESVVL